MKKYNNERLGTTWRMLKSFQEGHYKNLCMEIGRNSFYDHRYTDLFFWYCLTWDLMFNEIGCPILIFCKPFILLWDSKIELMWIRRAENILWTRIFQADTAGMQAIWTFHVSTRRQQSLIRPITRTTIIYVTAFFASVVGRAIAQGSRFSRTAPLMSSADCQP